MNKIHSIIQNIKNIFDNKEFIPLHEPIFRGNEKKFLLDCIDSSFVSSVGEYVNRFEDDIQKLTSTKYAIAVVNGTSALHISLKLAGVKKDDEVITQALTFVATANAISYLDANPIFIDVDRDTMGLSPEALLSFLDEFGELRENGTYNKKTGKKISACIPMHTFGFMCRIDKIIAICEKWKINVIEDAAEALGSTYKGKSAGSFGLINSFSFNGNKIITSGGGGAISTNSKQLGEKAKHITTTAKVPHKWDYFHDQIAYNYRMPNINAALVCAQLENLIEIKKNKRELYNEYKSIFFDIGVQLIDIPKDTDWNYWLISIVFENEKERNLFLEKSNNKGVMTRPIWKLMYKLPMYKNCQRDQQTNAEFLADRIVNIPSSAKIK